MKKAKWRWADKEEAQERSGDSGVRIPALPIPAALVHSFAGVLLRPPSNMSLKMIMSQTKGDS